MWSSLEETYGEVAGFDAAFARTRGVPLGLRREFARARFGAQAWDIATLERPARAALEALAILRQAVAPAAVAALAPGVEILRRRSERIAPIIDELKVCEKTGRLSIPIVELAPSYLHMHANRLLRSAQRAHEAVLYDFLARLYESDLARVRDQDQRASNKAKK